MTEASFQRAVHAFKSKSGLTHKDLQDVEATSLADLQKTIYEIQTQQKASRKETYLKRLQPFLKAMEQYGEVINIFVNTSSMLAFVWGPLKFLLLSLSNFSDAFNALLDGYYKIGRSLPILLHYKDLLQNNSFLQDAIVPIFEDILEFHTEAVKYFRQKILKTIFHSTWNHVNKRIVQLSDSLEQQKLFFESALRLSHYHETQAFRAECQQEFRKLQANRNQAQSDFDKFLRDHRHEQRLQVQQWLAADHPYTRHDRNMNRRHPETGTWLLAKPKFQSWYALHNCLDPLLWISGKPGAGKTILASFIIEEIKKLPNAVTAFFFCHSGDGSKAGFLTIARALLSQILNQNDELLPWMSEKACTSGQANLVDTRLAKELLETALKASHTTYIVIDGLDEYLREPRKEIASWFQDLIRSQSQHELGTVRCLFVSQEDGPARKDLSELSHIKITPADNTEDIRSFAKMKHHEIEETFGSLEMYSYDITSIITARAEGMFLYAYLVLENLLAQTSRRRLEQELDPKVFPEGLEQAYDRIIKRLLDPNEVHTSRREDTLKLLGWLTCAKRPLKWFEIQAAMSIDTSDCVFDIGRRPVKDSKDLCASLVEVGSDSSVTFVHSTAKDFLIRREYINSAEIDVDMAILCLIYLSLDNFNQQVSDEITENFILQGVYAFLDYAILFWGLHIEAGLSKIQQNTQQKRDHVQVLTECLEAFLEKHWQFQKPVQTISVSSTLRENLQLLADFDMFEETLRCISASKGAIRPLGKNTPLDGMLSIYQTLHQSRKVFESLVSSNSFSTDTKASLKDHYGDLWFKCSKFNCQYFHHGFLTNAHRQQHLERHDRSYICSVTGCSRSVIGCTTLKELQKHKLESHGIREEPEADDFPDAEEPPEEPPKENIQPVNIFSQRETHSPGYEPHDAGKRKTPVKFECSLCGKQFTRKGTLSHHRRTHTDERPFDCSICGKAFAKRSDVIRHENLHSGERRFSCKGCGQRFARADAVGKHLRSNIGKYCAERQRSESTMET